eukprot:6193584-Pleurochrysis_carterae.AAC.5
MTYGGRRASSSNTDVSAPAAQPARAADTASRVTRRRRAAPSSGFAACGNANKAVAASGDKELDVELTELMDLDGSDEVTNSAAMLSFYKESRCAERATKVLSVLQLWESFGKVYSAACSAWEADTVEYRAARALQFLHAGALPLPTAK